MKNIFKKVILSILGLSTVLAAPVVPVDMEWVQSYETSQFDTNDGDIGMNQYAVADEGSWYIRTVPKDRGHYSVTENPDDIKGKKEVSVVCDRCAYYSEFINKNGKLVREPYASEEYKKLGREKNRKAESKEFKTLLLANKARANISYDAESSGENTNITSLSFSHTTSGSERFLVVGAAMGDVNDAERDVASITYNSVALSQLRQDDDATGNKTTEFWYLVAPDTGSNTVQINLDGSGTQNLQAHVSSYTGVDQSTPQDNEGGSCTNDTSSRSTGVSTTNDGAWAVDVILKQPFTGNLTVGGSQTSLSETEDIFLFDSGMSYEGPQTPTGTITMSWSGGDSSTDWCHSVMTLKPTSFGGGPSDSCTYAGAGDWDVLYSDNCYIDSDMYVSGACNFIYDGAGSFGLAATLGCQEVNGGQGFVIEGLNDSGKIEVAQ